MTYRMWMKVPTPGSYMRIDAWPIVAPLMRTIIGVSSKNAPLATDAAVCVALQRSYPDAVFEQVP